MLWSNIYCLLCICMKVFKLDFYVFNTNVTCYCCTGALCFSLMIMKKNWWPWFSMVLPKITTKYVLICACDMYHRLKSQPGALTFQANVARKGHGHRVCTQSYLYIVVKLLWQFKHLFIQYIANNKMSFSYNFLHHITPYEATSQPPGDVFLYLLCV